LIIIYCSMLNLPTILFSNSPREGNHGDDYTRFTYRKLLEEVCRFANVLKQHGVNKGDRVAIYMPMIMETPIAMLACARIGAVHSIVVS
jgi:acetyl-CoA synthetase